MSSVSFPVKNLEIVQLFGIVRLVLTFIFELLKTKAIWRIVDMGIEMQILDGIQSLRTPFLDMLMPVVSKAAILWFLLPVLLFIRKDTRKASWIVLAAIVLDVVLCNGLLKNLIQRVRPCDVNQAVTLLVARPTDYSFPSGHTALSFAAVSGLWESGKRKTWRIPLLVIACVVAFSRLYLYLHYPTDILAGIAVGIFCGWAAMRLVRLMTRPQMLPATTTES